MATKRHLEKAPIREALIDIRCQRPARMDIVAGFATGLAGEGDRVSDLWEATMELRVEQQQPPTPSHTAALIGKRIDYGNRREVAQLRTAGCTYSRLAPYDTWEEMADKAFSLWAGFANAVQFETVERIAIRYINSLQLPLPILDFADYLNVPPRIPDGLPQEVLGFMGRIAFKRDEDIATVTQVVESGTLDGKFINFLIDIEVVTKCDHRALDTVAIRTTAERLREFKNDVFFGFVKDPAIERYA